VPFVPITEVFHFNQVESVLLSPVESTRKQVVVVVFFFSLLKVWRKSHFTNVWPP